MKKNTQGRSIDNIVVLIVFATFAFSVLMVLMLGAGVYRNISSITRENENARIALSYVRTKLRNLDDAGAFRVGEFNGVSALYISEQIGDSVYQTVIYAYDGKLYELFSDDLTGFTINDGIAVTPVHNMKFELSDDGTIYISAGYMSNTSDYGNTAIYPRSNLSVAAGGDD